MYWGGGGGGGGGGKDTYYVSVGRDVHQLPKRVQFSESVWAQGYSIVQILGRGSNIPV